VAVTNKRGVKNKEMKAQRNSLQLPVTPGMKRGESYLAYILRLSGRNGYGSPGQMLARVNKEARPVPSTRTKPNVLAGLTGRPLQEFSEAAYIHRRKRGTVVHVAGHEVTARMLRCVNPHFCLMCVKEKGIIEAHFDLQLMTACPQHDCSLVDICAACQKEISWNRQDLRVCGCGAELSSSAGHPCGGTTREFLEIVRRKVHGIPLGPTSMSGFPLSEMSQISLRSLLYLAETLGRRVVGGQADMNQQDYSLIVDKACAVLSNWPDNAVEWFEEIAIDARDEGVFQLTQQSLRGIYLCLLHGMHPKEDGNFVRHALSIFAVRNNGSGSHGAFGGGIAASTAAGFLSKKSFSALIGTDPRNVSRILQRNGIAAHEMPHGKQKRLKIERSSALLLLDKENEIYTLAEASRRLGIAVPVLRELKRSGVFDAKLRPGLRGFHGADINSLKREILAAADQLSKKVLNGVTWVPLRSVFKSTRVTVVEKVAIVKKILGGEMIGVKKTGDFIGGLFIPSGSFRKVVKKRWTIPKPNEEARSTWNCVEASGRLKVPSLVVRGLIRGGYIEAERSGRAWGISKESVAKFQMKYQSVASIAKSLGVPSAVVTRVCEQGAYTYISTEKRSENCRGGFVLGADVERLCRAVRDLQKERPRVEVVDRVA
jgi:hypothetical protein